MWIVHTSASIEPHRINWNYPIEIKKMTGNKAEKKLFIWKLKGKNKQTKANSCMCSQCKKKPCSAGKQQNQSFHLKPWCDILRWAAVRIFLSLSFVIRISFLLHVIFFLFIVCCLRNEWRGASLLLGSGEYNFRQHVYMILFVIPISSIDFHCSRHSLFHVRSNSQKKKTPVIIVSMCSVFCVHSHDYVHLKSNGNHGIHNLSRAHDLEWNVIEI